MIRLIRVDGLEILLNAEQIHSIEPDAQGGSLIRMLDGEALRVKNHHADITTKIHAWVLGRQQEEIDNRFCGPADTPGKP
ncbi:MAG: flagellar FlbD family protein [Acidobacteriota bacterium]|jgi:uncharacterized protein YlzI (FlbEa/FlbD family)|nr:flagellar FlbD family protein [Acidobacteriota bacterium]